MDPSGSDGHSTSSAGASACAAGAGAPAHLTEAQYATLQLLHYIDLLRARWILIAALTIGIGLGYGLYTKFLTVKWYRAQATVTPVPPEEGLSMGTGTAGDMVDGLGGGIASLLGGGGADTVTLAQRYTAIMNSYAFTTDLVSKYHLEHNIIGVRSKNAPTVTKWLIHTKIADRFSTEYDFKSGNLTLYFLDPSPAEAQRVLGFYLDSLRDKLRNEEVQAGASAAASLQDEVRKTSDALLQTQLYELMARQIQREKLAQVQSDFAFKVVEPPVVPDNYFAPKARNNAVLAASITFALVCTWILGSDFIRRAKAQFEGMNQAPDEPATTLDDPSPHPDDSETLHPRFVRNLRPKA
ncbi:Wzz/FepE/Etk N-terminal domain-containing protein [Candidatus Binatus sp.]|uniref:Wzz/FepE/Etk N-terminal domain-containing protein n=1 Tax=Candidatus Binatus sp. TaxID=2811406 RepID=UPI002F945718